MIQEKTFINSEADNYYLRNSEMLDTISFEEDEVYDLLKRQTWLSSVNSVLELGCSTGYRLNFLRDLLPNCKTFVGMDASKLAIEHGKQKYGLELYQGSLATFIYPKQFDLVIVNFVFCWLDRNLLYQCVANIDKFLKQQNSFLALGDFYPFYSYKRKYHHLNDIYIYIRINAIINNYFYLLICINLLMKRFIIVIS